MANNKVVLGSVTIIDISDTTAVASDVAQGKEFYGADGNKVVGTASGGITPTGTLAISQNGTYDVTNYASANVNVSGGGIFTIDDAQYLFSNGARLNVMNELLGLCDNVTNSTSMFSNCSSLTSLDLSNFDTSNVTGMAYMFFSCSSLTSLNLSSFNTSNVTSMQSMFQYCSSLTSLEIGTDDTTYSSSLNSAHLFSGCSSLDSVTIRGANVMRISNSNAFTNLKSDCKFYVPSNLVSAYKSATNWSARKNYIYAIS